MQDKIPNIKWNSADDDGPTTTKWWRCEDPKERGRSLQQVARSLSDQNSIRRREALIYTRCYQNVQLESLYRLNVSRSTSTRPNEGGMGRPMSNKVTFNVIRSCVDTVCAKIAKNKPRASFVTSGADYETKKRGQGLTEYIDGLFYQTDLYNKTATIFRDAGIYGTGVIKLSVDERDGTIHAERAMGFEFAAEASEALYGSPRTLYQTRPIHRETLLSQYGDTDDRKVAIMTATGAPEFSGGTGSIAPSEMLSVTESWHLPSRPGGRDGRHAIAIADCVLLDEPWIFDWFPVFLFHWCEPIVGLWGQGIAEELAGIQIEISKLLATIQRAQHLAAGFRVFVEEGSDVKTAHINNEIGEIIKFRGTMPIFDSVSRTVPPELYSHLENLVRKAYEITGVSQLSANAQKPPGLDAGVAIREMHDIESERFVKVGQRFETYHVDIARAMVELSAELYKDKRHKGLQVKAPGTKFLRTIKWAEVNLKEDTFFIRAMPTSSLPSTPAYRFQTVIEWKKAGVIDDEQMMQLLDMPDLERFTSLYTASINDIDRCLDAIVSRGEYLPPEPFMDLKRCVKMCLNSIFKGREDGIGDRKLELLLRWMDEARGLIDDATKPQAAPAAAPVAPQPDLSGVPPPDLNAAPMPGAAPMMPAPEMLPTTTIPALQTDVAAVPPPIMG